MSEPWCWNAAQLLCWHKLLTQHNMPFAVQELADLLGLSEPKISQQEAISRFYEYAKVHNLRVRHTALQIARLYLAQPPQQTTVHSTCISAFAKQPLLC